MPELGQSRHDVRILEFLNQGLARVTFDGDHALWARQKVRKPHLCVVTGMNIPVGAVAWAPVGNQMYRSSRIHDDVMTTAVEIWPELIRED